MSTQKKVLFLTLCPLFLLCTLSCLLFSDLQWPLKEKTYLTGTFGEFRKNHIHAGIDISTHGRIGVPIYAGETGYLYRIKVQYLGFGKAVYIRLKDRRILVYAHLDRFSPKIENIVKETQQNEGNYEVDIYLKDEILISQGELIGYSGDTGGVKPHLHLELRDPDDKPINPLNYLYIKDTTPPVIIGIGIFDLETTYCIRTFSPKEFTLPVEITHTDIGFGISTYDPSSGNRLGIYKIELLINGELSSTLKFDSFSYDEFRDNFLVYNKDLWVNKKKIYYHLFPAFNNNLPFYSIQKDQPKLKLGKNYIKIVVSDKSGNKSSSELTLVYNPTTLKKQMRLRHVDITSRDGLCRIVIEKEDFYYPFIPVINSYPSQKVGELIPVSDIYEIKPKEAVFKKATISIKHPPTEKIGLYKYEDGRWKFMDKDTITDFTKFAIFKDLTPPKLEILSTYPIFRARIEDNGSGLDYNKLALYIDNKKVIAEYSVNRKEFFYKIPPGKHRITCIAIDKVGNEIQKHLTNAR